MTPEYEKLGAFYLGREIDAATGKESDDILLYNSRDLTTHGVIIGMTGSGKTGLGISLLEEAAMDRIPVIAIDPKGDLANLLLTFPDLSPEDFLPWVNRDAARQAQLSPEAFAAQEAEKWRGGLADWHQDGERIRALREHAEFAVYTPGSSAARQVSLLSSFEAPAPALLQDADGFRERLQSTVTGLLGLLGIDADPIRSREHILLSAILDEAWRRGAGMDLGELIAAIQNPPITRLGVMELESVYPSKDRFELAMLLNGLLASPGFQSWLEGEPLDIPSLLYSPAGKPRVTIFSIAHLGDAERMFFVTLLLSTVTAWMRTQPGTDSLRALVYMDEIFGFLPPVANPPSKAPMLTLLKQARAFGVGLVLATQNPVDLDYKALGNAGTWFIGRLQTERDKQRVLEALDGAMAGSAPMDHAELDRLVSGLGKRVFLLHNVHRGAPRLFTTRWAMSYLAGPMTLNQLRLFGPAASAPATSGAGPGADPHPSDSTRAAADSVGNTPTAAARPASNGPTAAAAGAIGSGAVRSAGGAARPILPPEITQLFAPMDGSAEQTEYYPAVLAAMEVRYSSAKHGVDESRQVQVVVPLEDGVIPFSTERAEQTELSLEQLSAEPVSGATFAPLPAEAAQPRSYPRWGKELVRWARGAMPLTLLESNKHRVCSRPDESERDFRMRLADLGRQARDREAERLREKFEGRFRTLEDRLRRAEQAVEKREARSQEAILSTGLAALGAIAGALTGGRRKRGGGLLGAFLGSGRGRAGTAVRGVARTARSRQEIEHAEETVEAIQAQIAELEREFEEELQRLETAADSEEQLETVTLRPALSAISLRTVALLWRPT
ncbi:MAG TPA: DUF87 domain-containing protein [Longimicrobiaceae bacterium]